MKIAFISNEPPPYRIPVFDLVAREPGVTFKVFFCCRREPNRMWDLPPMRFPHMFLRERISTVKGRYIHNNPDVIPALRGFAPDIVVTDGFNPTHLYAFAYAWLAGCRHVAMTDGTDVSEQELSRAHRAVRRLVYGRTRAFVAASEGGLRLFRRYGIADGDFFKSCLCIDNSLFAATDPVQEKRYDLLFSGRLEEVKNPSFAIDLAAAVAKLLGRRVSLLFAGSGSMEQELRRQADAVSDHADVIFHGFAAQSELPRLYRSARVFVFPTRWDPWGVVANEACASGLPVIVTPHAGVAGELVREGVNGHVCELDLAQWAQRTAALLRDPAMYRSFASASSAAVRDYTYRSAASGLLAACRHAAAGPALNVQTAGE